MKTKEKAGQVKTKEKASQVKTKEKESQVKTKEKAKGTDENSYLVRAFVCIIKVLEYIETKEAISGVVREPDLLHSGSSRHIVYDIPSLC